MPPRGAWPKAATVTFNPLFLYGGVGLGKTHLMHAIAWHIREHAARAARSSTCRPRSSCTSFIRALRYKDTMAFKEQFRSVDVLMIDDVQFIAGKDIDPGRVLPHLQRAGGPATARSSSRPTSRRPTSKAWRSGCKSRLGWGLVADIHPTDLRAAPRHPAGQGRAARGAECPRKVLEFLAHQITSNVRELEGALNRVAAHATLVGRDDHARDRPGGAARPAARQRPAASPSRRSRSSVAEHFNIRARRHAFGAPRRAPSPGRARWRCIWPSS